MASKTYIPQGTLELFLVSDHQRLPVYLCGEMNASLALILVGGLTHGMGTVPYALKLAILAETQGFTLAQPHWSSAYNGYGTGSLKRDVTEIEACIKHLRRCGKHKIILMGHSAGCQDAMQYLLTAYTQTPIEGVILQSPYSDREALTLNGQVRIAKLAKEVHDAAFPNGLTKEDMIKREGQFWDCMPRRIAKDLGLEWLTYYRAWSLLCEGGDDDFFSSDIPIHADAKSSYRPLIRTFGKLPSDVPMLFVFSGADEYFPFQHGVTPQGNFSRWRRAAAEGMGEDVERLKLEMTVLRGASHSIKQPEAQEALMRVVGDFILRV